MNYIRELFKNKDKKSVTNLAAAFALGIILLVSSNIFFKDGSTQAKVENILAQDKEPIQQQTADMSQTYESKLEKRLAEVLSVVEGAGQVKVMLTLSYGREIIVAEDTVSSDSRTKEEDSEGGRREEYDVSSEGHKIIITGKDGVSQPLILKEIEPKVEGVIIIAQGGDNVFIQDALIRAAQTVLGVEPHKVQVLKMKSQESNVSK